MDLINVFVIFMAICCGSCVQGNTLETTTNVTAYMGQQATLHCKYSTSQIENLIFIRWARLFDNGSAVNLAMRRMPMTSGQPDGDLFVKSAPQKFVGHARTASNLTSNSITLDLIIDGLMCDDVGTYECQAMGISDTSMLKATSNLDIEVHPGTPAFKSDELQVSINTSFELRCEADVGTPPQVIVFSYKGPDMDEYVRVNEGVETAVTYKPATCSNRAVSSLAITMTEDMDNSRYMCSLPEAPLGRNGQPRNFDEIELRVFRTTTTPLPTEAPTTLPQQAEVGDSATAVSTSCATLLCCLVATFLLADRRTDS